MVPSVILYLQYVPKQMFEHAYNSFVVFLKGFAIEARALRSSSCYLHLAEVYRLQSPDGHKQISKMLENSLRKDDNAGPKVKTAGTPICVQKPISF